MPLGALGKTGIFHTAAKRFALRFLRAAGVPAGRSNQFQWSTGSGL